jgi:hypothetical protein
MKRNEKWFCYTFADGSYHYVRGYSRHELKIEIAKHGALISKEPA